MAPFSFSFLFGTCGLLLFSHIPSILILLLGLFISLLLRVYYKNILTLGLIGCLCGLIWSMLLSSMQLKKEWPISMEGKNIITEGTIASIPYYSGRRISFLFKTKTINKKPLKRLFKINWYYTTHHPHAGEKWRLHLRLKRPRGLQNPSGFDYEAWLFQNKIHATGYVQKDSHNHLMSSRWFRAPFLQLRETIQDRMDILLGDKPSAKFLPALIVGSRQFITEKEWGVLRKTGTNHLIAIAGLHIGFLSGLTFSMTCFLWRRIARLNLILSAKQVTAFVSLLIALLYSLLAGFSLPTQRACIMLVMILGGTIIKRHITSWHSFSCALLLILLLNPFVILGMSFWLSFSAVLTILYTMQGRVKVSGIKRIGWQWGRIQWITTVGILPFSLWFFGETSVISIFANTIAVPWFGFIILPLCFLGTIALFIHPSLATFLLSLSIKNIEWVWGVLAFFSRLSLYSWEYTIPHPLLLISLIFGILLFLSPKGFPARHLSAFFFLPLFTFHQSIPKQGEVWLTLLDVGQGLSVVVKTRHHTLIYDTGPGFDKNSNTGKRVILPYLNSQKIKNDIDLLIISHGDNDHIGGAESLLQGRRVQRILSSVPKRFKHPCNQYCLRGQSWKWDGVTFNILSPFKKSDINNNNQSCVLEIKTGNQRILLTGDIEKSGEKALLKQTSLKYKSTLLLAPHHGSKTSSTWPFVQTFAPKYLLYSTGYRNRFRLPHVSVIRNYTRVGAKQYNTAQTGAITFYLDGYSEPRIELYRKKHRRIWMKGN